MVFFFICFEKVMEMLKDSPFMKFPAYGFVTGAEFNFSASQTGNFSIFLVQQNKSIYLKGNNYIYDEYCSNMIFISEYNHSFANSSYWSDTIKTPGLYIPTLVVCNNVYPHLSIRMWVSRKDFRNWLKTDVYGKLSIFYFGLFLMWIVNRVTHRNFRIPIHYIYTYSTLMKGVQLACLSIYFRTDNKYILIIAHVFSILSHATNISMVGFVSSGYCTIRNDLSLREKLEICSSAFLFIFGASYGWYINSFIQAVLTILMCLIGLLGFFKVYVIATTMKARIQRDSICDNVLKKKLQLITTFQNTITPLFIVSLFMYFITALNNIWSLTPNLCIEVGLMFISVAQYILFRYKASYEGVVPEIQKQKKESAFVELVDPKHSEYVLVVID